MYPLEILRELLSYIPAVAKSHPPASKGGKPFIPELGAESDLTPLHLAAHQGNENVVRVLFNSAGVIADVKSKINVRRWQERRTCIGNFLLIHLALINV